MSLDKTSTNTPFIVTTNVPIPNLRQTFNNTQNWTVPSGVNGIWVHLVGGGAGGNGRVNSPVQNGQGGSGGCYTVGYTPVTPGETVGITIGAGGSGGASQNTDSGNQYGGSAGDTFVNTTNGMSFGAGGGKTSSTFNSSNGALGQGFTGPLYGVTRQIIAFSSLNINPHQSIIFGTGEQEGSGYGAAPEGNFNVNTTGTRNGNASTLGGASGAAGSTNGAGSAGGTGGAQNMYAYNGGNGVAGAASNAGGGGGGAGIAGNGGNASGASGGAGGAGGGGGGGGGTAGGTANTANGGAGGAGCVKVYY